MSKLTHLSADWRAWIVQNLGRGCSELSLVEAMVEKQFEPAFAQLAVRALRADSGATLEPLASADDYVYETSRLAAGNVIHAADREVRVAMRVCEPVIAVLDNVLSAEECDELIRRSADKLQRSTTVDPTGGGYKVIAERSSEGTFFPVNADDFIARIDRRIAALMGCPVENGEGLQVLHYNAGGEYRPHYDYFSPDDAGCQAQMVVGGQRIATLVMYLNEVEQGGATSFPELGLEVLPKKGSAVYFEYSNSLGQVNPLTLHAGEPVEKGEKWIVTKWMRQRRYSGAV
ncbi:MAG: 2OG-Fe(II) oxygenase [Rhodanobacter sp.]